MLIIITYCLIFCAVMMTSCEVNASDAANGRESGDGQKSGTVSAVDAANGRETGVCGMVVCEIVLVALVVFAIDRDGEMAFEIDRDVLLGISIGAWESETFRALFSPCKKLKVYNDGCVM